MYYKNHGQQGWAKGLRVILPDNTEMNESNRNDWTYPVNGWTWHDEPPQEYLDWEASLDEMEIEPDGTE